ncbi:MAG: hypothetical protein EB120_05000 [Proteobacteria bacterium]|nr:hypothetical protein [Pseudomonadota bacterium]
MLRIILIALCLIVGRGGYAEPAISGNQAVNKLLHMYELFYLPFSIEFKQGRSYNDIFPLVSDKTGKFNLLLKPEDLTRLDSDYLTHRAEWSKTSLFLSTQVELGESERITQRLVAHRIPLKRGAWDKISMTEQIQVKTLLEGKPEAVKKAVTQIQFLRSFLKPHDDEKFNFFVIGPNWCESSKEYRYILEYYAKKFVNPDLILHSVVIEDPKQQIFDSELLKTLFPFPENYSHESVPRFLAIQNVQGKLKVWEEGDALRELKDRFFAQYRGFLNSKFTLLSKIENSKRSLASVGP